MQMSTIHAKIHIALCPVATKLLLDHAVAIKRLHENTLNSTVFNICDAVTTIKSSTAIEFHYNYNTKSLERQVIISSLYEVRALKTIFIIVSSTLSGVPFVNSINEQ